MIKALLGSATLVALACAAPAHAQGAQCDRADLQKITDAYLAAQTAGDSLKLPLADFTSYTEQGEDASMSTGQLSHPYKIEWHRTLFDLRACATYTELVISDPAHPFVIGTRLQFSGRDNPIAPSRVNSIESVITDQGDRLFNAAKTLAAAQGETWTEIPAAERDSRDVIVAAANAYLDALGGAKAPVPYATPCAKLEGGLYTVDRCDADQPTNVKVTDRRYLVDEALGAVAVMDAVGPGKLPDVHTFRVEKGKIRYVHALTVCNGGECGLPVTDAMKQRVAG